MVGTLLNVRQMVGQKGQITDADVKRLRGLVISTARDLYRRLAPNSVLLEDLISEGWVALLKSANRWDESYGVPFESFIRQRMQGGMKDHLRSIDVVPRSKREMHRRYERSRSTLEIQHCRHATRAEIAAHMQVELAVLDDMLNGVGLFILHSLDAPSENGMLHDIIRDSSDVVADLAAKEFSSEIHSYIARLPKSQRKVIEMRYFRGMLLKDIGSTLGVSESRASQLHTQALGSLKAIIEEFSLDQLDVA